MSYHAWHPQLLHALLQASPLATRATQWATTLQENPHPALPPQLLLALQRALPSATRATRCVTDHAGTRPRPPATQLDLKSEMQTTRGAMALMTIAHHDGQRLNNYPTSGALKGQGDVFLHITFYEKRCTQELSKDTQSSLDMHLERHQDKLPTG